MNQSESINELATALSKAQGEIGGAGKDGTNKFQDYKYTTLGAVIRAAKEPLAKNGLCYVQMIEAAEDGVAVTTRLMHGAEWLESTIAQPIDTQKGRSQIQAAGSTITYLRKYALMALLGIPSEDDPDEGKHESTGGQYKGRGKQADKKRASKVDEVKAQRKSEQEAQDETHGSTDDAMPPVEVLRETVFGLLTQQVGKPGSVERIEAEDRIGRTYKQDFAYLTMDQLEHLQGQLTKGVEA